jgi:hypothetical protein
MVNGDGVVIFLVVLLITLLMSAYDYKRQLRLRPDMNEGDKRTLLYSYMPGLLVVVAVGSYFAVQ